jgi:excisionase family DNA binding protein
MTRTPCRIKRAAELLGKSVDATYQDVARGRIPYRRFGRTLVFFEEEIVEHLDRLPGLRGGSDSFIRSHRHQPKPIAKSEGESQ